MKPNSLPSFELLQTLFSYDEDTGEVTWKVARGNRKAGVKAGSLNQNGYVLVQVNKKMVYVHRIIWTIYHREDLTLDDIIDHINGDRTDNRITNLRKVTHSENNLNRSYKPNTANRRGISYNKHGKKPWQVRLGFQYLGCYENLEEAIEVRTKAEQERGNYFRNSEVQ